MLFKNVYMHMYTHIYPISYIQSGNIPIRDSRWDRPQRGRGGKWGVVVWGEAGGISRGLVGNGYKSGTV